MHITNERSNTAVITSLIFLSGIAFLYVVKSPLAIPGMVLFAGIVFFIAFVNTDAALIILIFSMLLSPEIGIGGVPGREVVIRVDDLLLLVIFFSWISKMAIHKELGLLRSNPLVRPILAYVFIAVLATLFGALQGHVNIKSAFFYVLKYIEYFLLFFMVANNLRDMGQVRKYVFLLLLVCLIVSIYAWYLKLSGFERVAAPFDISEGEEANTLGGYLLFMMAIAIGIIVYCRSLNLLMPLLLFLGLIVPPFLFTLSRGSWLGFFPMLITIVALTKRARLVLVAGLLLIIALLPVVIPQSVKQRIDVTFASGKTYNVLGKDVTIAESGSLRIDKWIRIMHLWTERPFLGYGVTGLGIVDAQYPRVLGETGIMGFIAYMWIMAIIFIKGKQTLDRVEEGWAKGLTLGFLGGFAGLLVQALTASTFIIVRIMEPFCFLAAIVIMLPEIGAAPEGNSV
ncbi:MAG: hypothetical protein C4581_02270 [Nitrospiraceae bacterium]|nr:MAG: hypothetical protein C4581_02270 [Nitrospiraceae bacterium]